MLQLRGKDVQSARQAAMGVSSECQATFVARRRVINLGPEDRYRSQRDSDYNWNYGTDNFSVKRGRQSTGFT